MKKFFATTALAAIAISGAAIAQEDPAKTFIDASNAMIEGNQIKNVSASIERKGYLVIHNEGAGAPPASVGHIALQPGMNENLTIDATEALDPSTNISLMLHYETNDNDTYDFGAGMTDVDTPVSVGDAVVMAPVKGGM